MNAGINPDSIRRALLADSYFIWLNENAENLPFAGVRHQPFWHEPALGDTRFVAFAPRELMEAHATTGSLNYLPYELAWLRIVRDFDPTIDPQTRRLAHAILQFYKTYVAILRIFNRLEAIDSPLVWALAFTSEKAKDSRERLDFLIKQHFSQHFPEAYWERVQQAIEREEPFVLKSVCALLDAKLPSQRLEVLDYLRERLGLPANLNVELLHSAIMMGANGEEEAFVQFLVRNDPEIATRFREPEIGLIYNQILQITELDQAFQERRFGFMVEDELGRVPFSY